MGKLFKVVADECVDYLVAANSDEEAKKFVRQYEFNACGDPSELYEVTECVEDVQVYCEDFEGYMSGHELAKQANKTEIISCSDWEY